MKKRFLISFFVFFLLAFNFFCVFADTVPDKSVAGVLDSEYSVPSSPFVVTLYHSDGWGASYTIDPLYSSLNSSLGDTHFVSSQITSEDGDYYLDSSVEFYDYEVSDDFFVSSFPSGSASCDFDSLLDPSSGSSSMTYATVEARGLYISSDFNNYDSYISSFIHFVDTQLLTSAVLDVYFVPAGDPVSADGLLHYSFSDFSNGIYSIDIPDEFFSIYPDDLYYVPYVCLTLNLDSSLNVSLFRLLGNTGSIFSSEFRNSDLEAAIRDGAPITPMNPGIFKDYTSWIGTAVGGFLDLEFVEGFTLGGILMTLIGFSVAIWFLKLFAGG